MNDNIRESLARLKTVASADLAAVATELTTLLTALRNEINAQNEVLSNTASTDPNYSAATGNVVGLLQLTQAVADSQPELGKLATAAEKIVQRVLKKAPK